jgi:hypothetical protein
MRNRWTVRILESKLVGSLRDNLDAVSRECMLSMVHEATQQVAREHSARNAALVPPSSRKRAREGETPADLPPSPAQPTTLHCSVLDGVPDAPPSPAQRVLDALLDALTRNRSALAAVDSGKMEPLWNGDALRSSWQLAGRMLVQKGEAGVRVIVRVSYDELCASFLSQGIVSVMCRHRMACVCNFSSPQPRPVSLTAGSKLSQCASAGLGMCRVCSGEGTWRT